MELKIPTIEITNDNPFANCKLGRSLYATILEQVLETFTNGCVMSLNGEWGSGKTTFVRMWRQQLINNGYDTIYFNAWETDFISDPLIGLIGELKELSTRHQIESDFLNVASAAGKLVFSATPTIFKNLAKHYIGEDTAEVVESIANGGIELFQKELDQYTEDCRSIKAFQESLNSYIKSRSNEKPLIFFIDELDRCNPHYAVKVLERIKHLFSIPQIIFVLSIDKEQLCHSVCGYYGSEQINANEYLRRFIDIEYNLPSPDYDKYFDFLIEEMNFTTFFYRDGLTQNAKTDADYFSSIAKMLFTSKRISLRQMEKIMLHARLALQTFPKNYKVYPNLIIFSLYLRFFESEIYTQIKRRELSVQELITLFEDKLPDSLIVPKDIYIRVPLHNITDTIAGLISAYNKDQRGLPIEELIDLSDQDNPRLKLKISKLNEEYLTDALKYYTEDSASYKSPTIDYLLNHIELCSDFQR